MIKEQSLTVNYKDFSLKISVFLQKRSFEYILFLHGIQSSKAIFSPFLEKVFLHKYSLLAVDFVGFGNSSKPENFSYDIQDQANIICEIIRQLPVEKLHIVGHSLGGTIAILLLQQLKNKIVSFINLEGNLTLADSGLTKEVAHYSFLEFSDKQYKILKQKIMKSIEPSASQRSNWLRSIPDYVFYKTSVSLVNWARNGELLKLFNQASCKKEYIIGEKNIFKKNIIPKSVQIITIPNAGHFMLIDNPEATYSAIEKFLKTTKNWS